MLPTVFIPQEQYEASPWDAYEKLPGGMRVSRHPLYVSLLMGEKEKWPKDIPSPDEIVKHRLERLEEAYHAKDLHRYVFTHERPFRFSALLDAQRLVEDDDSKWFEVAGSVWVDSEGPGRNIQMWRDLVFATHSPNHYCLMTPDEFVEFKNIKEPLVIYRGANSKHHARTGLAWTTDRDQAVWFARRYSSKTAWVAEATVKRIKLAAVFLRRAEKEVILARPPRGAKIERI